MEDVKIFLRSVDGDLFDFVSDGQTPLFVVGEAEHISFLKNLNKSGKFIAGEKAENYAHRSKHEIASEVYPVVLGYSEKAKHRQLELLQESKGYSRFAGGIRNVWKAAKLGQVLTLFVEKSYAPSARVMTDNELELEALAENEPEEGRIAKWHHDIVDDLIELVNQMDGSVVFVEDGVLRDDEQIAAILRFSL